MLTGLVFTETEFSLFSSWQQQKQYNKMKTSPQITFSAKPAKNPQTPKPESSRKPRREVIIMW